MSITIEAEFLRNSWQYFLRESVTLMLLQQTAGRLRSGGLGHADQAVYGTDSRRSYGCSPVARRTVQHVFSQYSQDFWFVYRGAFYRCDQHFGRVLCLHGRNRNIQFNHIHRVVAVLKYIRQKGIHRVSVLHPGSVFSHSRWCLLLKY